MKERLEAKIANELKNKSEKLKTGGLSLPRHKLYIIDKMVRKKLQEKSGEPGGYSELVDPLVNEKYDVLGLGPGPDEVEEPSAKIEETKGPQSPFESKDVGESHKNHDLVLVEPTQEQIQANPEEKSQGAETSSKKITFDEWLYKKEAETKYWKLLLEAEKEELKRMEEEKEREKQELTEQKYGFEQRFF